MSTSLYEPNVAIYERLGFKLGKVGKVEDRGEELEVPVLPLTDADLVLLHDAGTSFVNTVEKGRGR